MKQHHIREIMGLWAYYLLRTSAAVALLPRPGIVVN